MDLFIESLTNLFAELFTDLLPDLLTDLFTELPTVHEEHSSTEMQRIKLAVGGFV